MPLIYYRVIYYSASRYDIRIERERCIEVPFYSSLIGHTHWRRSLIGVLLAYLLYECAYFIREGHKGFLYSVLFLFLYRFFSSITHSVFICMYLYSYATSYESSKFNYDSTDIKECICRYSRFPSNNLTTTPLICTMIYIYIYAHVCYVRINEVSHL